MRAPRGICCHCGEPVGALESAAWPVIGWEAERGSGGANHVIGRQRVVDGRISHVHCARRAAELARKGIAREQGSLL